MLNTAQFSAAKDLAETKALQALAVTADGFNDFKKKAYEEVTSIGRDQWLRVEMDSCIRGAVMGESWRKIEESKDQFPYWVYRGEMDEQEREEHEALEGLIFRIGDPEGDSICPPNDWNCRCRPEPADEGDIPEGGKVSEGKDYLEKDDPETGKPYIDPDFRFNPGKTGTMPNDSSYSEVLPSANSAGVKLFEEPISNIINWPEIAVKEDYDLSEDKLTDFVYDLQKSISGKAKDYAVKDDILIRIKDHIANYNNFYQDIEEFEYKGVLNTTVGNYDNISYREKDTIMDMLKNYPELKAKEIMIEDGASLFDSIKKVRESYEELHKEIYSQAIKQIEKEEIKGLSIKEAQSVMKEYVIDKKTDQSLFSYTSGSYNPINGKLRGRLKEISEITESNIKPIEEFIQKAPKVKATTYRGLSFSELDVDKFISTLKKDAIWDDAGFMSTSYDKAVATKFGTTDRVKCLVQIEGKNGVLIERFSAMPEEKEVIFNRNSKMKVKDFKIKRDKKGIFTDIFINLVEI
jgi:SPP1 gp7 family putative phage head morphogenesis protein